MKGGGGGPETGVASSSRLCPTKRRLWSWNEAGGQGGLRELVGGDVGGAAAVAGGGLGPLDVEVQQLHLWEGHLNSF